MDIHESWGRALKQTEIIRSRISPLPTFSDTEVSYIHLSESSINHGDTVVRRGHVRVHKPAVILPPNIPQLEGFGFEDGGFAEQSLINFLLVRGVSMPSLKYDHHVAQLEVLEGALTEYIRQYQSDLQRKEDVATGLIVGPGDVWHYSIIIFICFQIAKNTQQDIQRLMDEYKKKA